MGTGSANRGWPRSGLAMIAIAIATAVAPTGALAQVGTATMSSGSLEAVIRADPFEIEFRDLRSGRVLRTLAGNPPSPTDPSARYGGPGYSFDLRIPVVNNAFLGYYTAAEAETIWFHGTELISATPQGGALLLDVETNDPLGHRLAITLSPTREGAITIDSRIAPGSGPLADLPSLSGSGFELVPGERFLGFGERSNAADQTGNLVFSWAEEGPFSSGEGEDLMRPLVPDFTFPSGPTATNFPIPWALTTRGFGALIDQTQRSTFRLGDDRPDAWHAEAEAPFFKLTVFAGPRPADVLHRYSDYAGRQPDPAPWIFGPWFQPTLESEPYELARRFRDEDVPTTVAQTYTHYLPCGAHVGQRDAERARVAAFHRLGYKVTTYFNPHVCTTYSPTYDQAAANGYFVENQAGQPYVVTNPFTADEQVSEVDFTSPGARAFYRGLLDEAIDDGYDGWMEDFGEYTPTDSVFSDGREGLEMHNAYPVLYHCTSYEHTRERYGREAAVFVRSGFHGVQPCARIVWGGDPTEDWSCSDGLCAAVHQALSTGLSGVAYWGSDIGGFHAIVNPRTSDELNIRWLQLGAVSGVMRTQANGFSFEDNRAERSQVWHPAVLPIWRRYAKLRTQLLPYIEGASETYQRTGMPITRHLALVFPNDAAAIAEEREFMFGPDLLAAPVIEEGARDRSLYVPRGRWVDLWRTLAFERRTGAFVIDRPARTIGGGRRITVPAPLSELPLLARAGTVLPLLWHDVDTLAPEGEAGSLVNLSERARRLKLLAFPRGRSVTRLADGGRIVSRERRVLGAGIRAAGGPASRRRAWTLRIQGDARRLYRVRAALSTLRHPFRPCRVAVNGRPLPPKRWRYRRRTRVLETSLRVRRGTLRARPCPVGR